MKKYFGYFLISVTTLLFFLFAKNPESKKRLPIRTPASLNSVKTANSIISNKEHNGTKPVIEKQLKAVSTPDISTDLNKLEENLAELRKHISEAQLCLQQGDCDYKENDPRSYEISVYKKLELDIHSFKESIKQNNNAKSTEIQKISQELISMENGAIKELALDLMASQVSNPGNIEYIIKDVLAYHDSNLIVKGLNELTRYLGTDQEAEIQGAIMKNLTSGSLLVREKLSEQITPFISKNYLSQYQEFVKKTPANSKVRKNIHSALNEWTMKQQGG